MYKVNQGKINNTDKDLLTIAIKTKVMNQKNYLLLYIFLYINIVPSNI